MMSFAGSAFRFSDGAAVSSSSGLEIKRVWLSAREGHRFSDIPLESLCNYRIIYPNALVCFIAVTPDYILRAL